MLRLRQICLVAERLGPAVDDLAAVLGLEVCYRDPAVAKYGLENALLPIGHDFLEVVAPVEAGTAAGRYLERRGGDGGYIVILQSDDAERRRTRYPEIGVRVANTMEHGGFLGTQLHPKDTGGCMLEVDRQEGDVVDGAWDPAGHDWAGAVRTDRTAAMTGCTLQGQDPDRLARRWAEILERPAEAVGAGFRIPLDNGAIAVLPPQDDRGDGLIGVSLRAADPDAILDAARTRGLPTAPGRVTIAGTHFDFA
ncbi:MAG: VOC family protein [Alphaproteobacteria bacterium]